MNNWRIFSQHVMPIGDLHEHIADPKCFCKPTDDDGVWVHHSLDKREEFEPDYQYGVTRQAS